jgi:hypothetical protein
MIELLMQGAIYSALTNDAPVTALVGGRVHDAVPAKPVFPYVRIGEDQCIDASDACLGGFEIIVKVHVFSRAVGRVETKTILAACRDALNVALTLAGHTVKVSEFLTTRVLDDPDGLTRHGVLELRYVIEVG